jgi:hypothetical protein
MFDRGELNTKGTIDVMLVVVDAEQKILLALRTNVLPRLGSPLFAGLPLSRRCPIEA